MSSSTVEPFTAAVLTVSDSCARGEKQDLSGPAVAEAIQKFNFTSGRPRRRSRRAERNSAKADRLVRNCPARAHHGRHRHRRSATSRPRRRAPFVIGWSKAFRN